MPMKNEEMTTLIKTRFPEAIAGENVFRNELTLTVRKDAVADVARFLKENEELDFDFLSDLCGVDRVETDDVFEVVYHLYSLSKNHRVRLKASVPSDAPHLPTVTGVWSTANWHERETYDMFGVAFDGHPDLRKILTPDDFEGYPLRKDYPLDGRQPATLRDIYRKGEA
ncbi:MAG: NADH-quinone oxidoreductase subunit C [Candidatus Brocadia sp.]|nr:MAG: NADH-quinone oxidoreductase subunit C [Candidatus Brocadia sp.]